jgi:hypothetical protein
MGSANVAIRMLPIYIHGYVFCPNLRISAKLSKLLKFVPHHFGFQTRPQLKLWLELASTLQFLVHSSTSYLQSEILARSGLDYSTIYTLQDITPEIQMTSIKMAAASAKPYDPYYVAFAVRGFHIA